MAVEAERDAFDRWYATDHLVAAKLAFGAQKAWRFWSRSDPSVHCAVYLFADHDALNAALASAASAELIADFDRTWPSVPRTRDVLENVQILA